jgi:hypothetical protein
VQVVVLARVTGSSGGLYTLHDVWERPPANNLPLTPHSAGAYGTGYVWVVRSCMIRVLSHIHYLFVSSDASHLVPHEVHNTRPPPPKKHFPPLIFWLECSRMSIHVSGLYTCINCTVKSTAYSA